MKKLFFLFLLFFSFGNGWGQLVDNYYVPAGLGDYVQPTVWFNPTSNLIVDIPGNTINKNLISQSFYYRKRGNQNWMFNEGSDFIWEDIFIEWGDRNIIRSDYHEHRNNLDFVKNNLVLDNSEIHFFCSSLYYPSFILTFNDGSKIEFLHTDDKILLISFDVNSNHINNLIPINEGDYSLLRGYYFCLKRKEDGLYLEGMDVVNGEISLLIEPIKIHDNSNVVISNYSMLDFGHSLVQFGIYNENLRDIEVKAILRSLLINGSNEDSPRFNDIKGTASLSSGDDVFQAVAGFENGEIIDYVSSLWLGMEFDFSSISSSEEESCLLSYKYSDFLEKSEINYIETGVEYLGYDYIYI